MKRVYQRWFSQNLNRDMELLAFGDAGAKVLIFPTREGRFYDYEDWGLVEVLAPSIASGQLQLFCVDSIDTESLYNTEVSPRSRIARHNQYEKYLLDEVVPCMRQAGSGSFFITHGCSIGAFHAVNIALRHPDLFGKVVALSGRYDLTKEAGPFKDLFDGYYDQDIYFHTPAHFISQLTDACLLKQIRSMQIVLAVGEEDPFKASNESMSRILTAQSIPHRLDIWDGEAHRPRHWRSMIQRHL